MPEGFAPRCHLKARYITGWGGGGCGTPQSGHRGGLAGAHRASVPTGQKDNRPPDRFQLTFPLRTNYMYAKVKKSLPEMYAFSVCMWIKSSASPGMGTPFSYAVPGQANELVLIEWGNNPMEILINDKVWPWGGCWAGGKPAGGTAWRSPLPTTLTHCPQVAKLPFAINDGKWHHICVTWTTRDGVWEAYQDGTQTGNGENLAPYHPIKPQGVLVLGQEQVRAGGGGVGGWGAALWVSAGLGARGAGWDSLAVHPP